MKARPSSLRMGIPLGAALLLMLLGGCGSPAERVVPGARADLLEFLQDGSTTRAEALLRLGQPSATLEHDNIITFRIAEDMKKGYYLISPREKVPWMWEAARYSLVLVFNAEGVLQKHNLVLVK